MGSRALRMWLQRSTSTIRTIKEARTALFLMLMQRLSERWSRLESHWNTGRVFVSTLNMRGGLPVSIATQKVVLIHQNHPKLSFVRRHSDRIRAQIRQLLHLTDIQFVWNAPKWWWRMSLNAYTMMLAIHPLPMICQDSVGCEYHHAFDASVISLLTVFALRTEVDLFWHLLRDNVRYDKEKKENQVNFNMVRLVLHYLHNMRLIHLLFQHH